VVENPTYTLIEKKLEEYNRNFNTGKFDKDGQLLIFFSGHGARQLTNGYFLPSDVNPDDLKRSAFNYKIWRDDMDAIDCKHILVAIDACYSGSFDPKFGMKTDGLFGTRAGELTERQRLITEHEKHKTRLFFTSGESDQPTPDKSDFAKKFLASLLTKGYDDGVLTSSEMFSNHLEKAAPRPRTGDFGGDEVGSSFLFIANNNNMDVVTEWKKIKNSNAILEYEGFIEKFKDTEYAYIAKEKLEILKTGNKNLLPFEPEMVFVQGGEFNMGSGNGNEDEKPIHKIYLTDFYIGKYEITQKQWRDVLGKDPNFLKYRGCDNCPVESINWIDIQEYLKQLNKKTGKNYRLPTEAEWEYAARGGIYSKNFTYSGSNNLYEVSYSENESIETHIVGTKKPNELGIYDMSGSVWEICSDWYDAQYYAKSSRFNPSGSNEGAEKVARGGSFTCTSHYHRVTRRHKNPTNVYIKDLGLRVVMR
jgi:formylglycine-generating enzyme required for sulfatase activity